MAKRNLFREKYGKMTDEQLAEYQAIVDLGCESEYWKDKLDSAFISFAGVMGLCAYVLYAVNPSLLVSIGILSGVAVMRSVTKLRVVDATEE